MLTCAAHMQTPSRVVPRLRLLRRPGVVLLVTITTAKAQAPAPVRARVGQSVHWSAAYDQARQRVVAFGTDGIVGVTETWELQGGLFTQRASTRGPSARYSHAMAYDSARRRVVLFGGHRSQSAMDDTWEWDGADWTRQTPALAPGPRSQAAMAYDAARRRVVLFGGSRLGLPLADTWEWDGNTWTPFTPARSPGARTDPAMAYDAARQRTVLFGGAPGTETWEWDGANWTAHAPAPSPGPRVRHGMTYDPRRQRVVLFGGLWNNALDDTWEWDGTTWRQLSPVLRPGPRHGSLMIYDDVRQRSVLTGGFTDGQWQTTGADVWEWDGTAWTQIAAPSHPRWRNRAALAYDGARNAVVLFGGGLTVEPNSDFDDTWEWRGSWRRRAPAVSPIARRDHAMVYDAARQRIVLFGGGRFTATGVYVQLNDTWEWDGNVWTRPALAISPSPRSAAMAYDASRRRTVLFGGPDDDTWEWDGATWTRFAPAVRPPVTGATAMAYDEARQRIVLCATPRTGGFAQTWEWDGSAWQRGRADPPTIAPSMTYDPVRRVVVAFGTAGGQTPARAWHWNGTQWTERAGCSLPMDAEIVFDVARRRLLLLHVNGLWQHGGDAVAHVQQIGTPCSANAHPTRIASGLPWVGNDTFDLRVVDARPSSLAAFGLAGATRSVPVGPCELHLQDPVFLAASGTDHAGTATLPVPLPFAFRLHGASLYTQAFVLDPTSALPAFSAALRIGLGD